MTDSIDMIPCDRLFNRIEDELSSYSNNGAMDIGKFYTQVKWFIEQLGIASYEFKEAILVVKDYKVELPCDFYLLDSAWLCECGANSFTQSNFQGQFQIYTEKTCETVSLTGCNNITSYGIVAQSCPQETVLDKITIKEYINSDSNSITWQNPTLLSLGSKVSRNQCASTCKNLFCPAPENISIYKQGNSKYLYSNLKDATIYIKYYRYPMDDNTQLPLVPDDAIMEEALFYHLILYFFRMLYLNNEETNLENKIKYLEGLAKPAIDEAKYLSKLPSFVTMIENAKRRRKRFFSYEVQFQNYHR